MLKSVWKKKMKNNANPLEDKELNSTESTTTVETETNEPTAEAAAEPIAEATDLEKLRLEAADWKDKYVRLYAEFENFRHRTAKERLALIGTATENLMAELLPIIDDFERTQKALESAADIESLKEGIALVFHKMMKTLTQKGLKAMDSVGQPFDPELQEAITQFPAPTPEQKGKVMDVVEKGYTLNDKTIRFAKVVIGA